MKEIFVTGKTLPDAYHKALVELYDVGNLEECADWNQKQLEVSMTFVVDNALEEPMISKCFIGGHRELMQYQLEIIDGILDFHIGLPNMWSYTYSNRMKKQLPFIINELKRNKSTRRAIMSIRDFEVDSNVEDPACLQSLQYLIRDDKLHCKVLMRSNDACKASYMNSFGFIMLQKKIADEVGIEVGSYTHRANSFHAYERDFDLLKQYVTAIENFDDVTYEYEGFYKELMEEEIPSIMTMVQSQKEKYGVK